MAGVCLQLEALQLDAYLAKAIISGIAAQFDWNVEMLVVGGFGQQAQLPGEERDGHVFVAIRKAGLENAHGLAVDSLAREGGRFQPQIRRELLQARLLLVASSSAGLSQALQHREGIHSSLQKMGLRYRFEKPLSS